MRIFYSKSMMKSLYSNSSRRRPTMTILLFCLLILISHSSIGLINGEETDSNLQEIESPVPGDLSFASGSTVSFGDDIELTCQTSNTDYKIWFDTNVDVEIYDSSSLTTKVYTWPTSLVTDTADSESGASNSVAITLLSVPQALYDLETVHVKLTVRFRNVAGDNRRRFRLLTSDQSGTSTGGLRGAAAARRRAGIDDDADDTTNNVDDNVITGFYHDGLFVKEADSEESTVVQLVAAVKFASSSASSHVVESSSDDGSI